MQISFDPHSPEDLALIRRILGSETPAPALDALQEQPTPALNPEDVFKPGPDADSDRELAQAYGAGVVPPDSPYWVNDETREIATNADDLSAEGFRRTTREEWEAFANEPTVAAAFAPDPSAGAMPTAGNDGEDDVRPDDHSLDSAGLPWDARIHASTRTKLKADGRWKQKRGVDVAIVEAVEAELRAVMAIPAPPAAATPPPPPPPPLPPVGAGAPAAPVSAPPPAPVSAGTAAADAPKTFPQFMQWLAPKLTAKALTHDHVREAVLAEGLPSVEKLVARPDLIPLVVKRLDV